MSAATTEIDLLDAILAAVTDDGAPETLRCPPSAPVTERTVQVTVRECDRVAA
jgi:hypothetical protein